MTRHLAGAALTLALLAALAPTANAHPKHPRPTVSQAQTAVKRELRKQFGPGDVFAYCHRLTAKRFSCRWNAYPTGDTRWTGSARATRFTYGWDVNIKSECVGTDCPPSYP